MGALYGMELDVYHISGPSNVEAGAFSRWPGEGAPPHSCMPADHIRIPLKSLWIPIGEPSFFRHTQLLYGTCLHMHLKPFFQLDWNFKSHIVFWGLPMAISKML